MRAVKDSSLHVWETPGKQQETADQMRYVRHGNDEDCVVRSSRLQAVKHSYWVDRMLQHVAADNHLVQPIWQGGLFDAALIDLSVERGGVRGPNGMWLNRIDDEPVSAKKLPEEPLGGSDVEHRLATELAHQRGDLLLATLGFAVKDVWAVGTRRVAAMRRERTL